MTQLFILIEQTIIKYEDMSTYITNYNHDLFPEIPRGPYEPRVSAMVAPVATLLMEMAPRYGSQGLPLWALTGPWSSFIITAINSNAAFRDTGARLPLSVITVK